MLTWPLCPDLIIMFKVGKFMSLQKPLGSYHPPIYSAKQHYCYVLKSRASAITDTRDFRYNVPMVTTQKQRLWCWKLWPTMTTSHKPARLLPTWHKNVETIYKTNYKLLYSSNWHLKSILVRQCATAHAPAQRRITYGYLVICETQERPCLQGEL